MPVKAWALVGAAFLILELVAYGGWIISGQATRTPKGPTPVPTYMQVAAVTWTVAGLFATAVTLYFFLVRPWRREGRISLDGLFCLAFIASFWQDPLLNYLQPIYTYNAVFPNWGSWTSHVPGWLSPHGHLFAEPLLWVAPLYIYVIFVMVVFTNFLMRRAQARWPRLGNLGLVMLVYFGFFAFTCIIEPIWLRLGFYSFPGTISWLTINRGHYYQFPLTEAIFMSAIWTAYASVRFFRDDRGRTIAERGVDTLRPSEGRRTGLRFLALTGIVNAITLVLYMVPVIFASMYATGWPDDIAKRSYLTDGLCGRGTEYACPALKTPVPRRTSDHLTPDGRVVPASTTTKIFGEERR